MDTLLTVLPLVSALFYAFGFVMIKRASSDGVGVASLCFFCNAAMLLVYFPGLFTAKDGLDFSLLFWPILCGVIYFIGQLCTFAAVYFGDVTLVNPLMGAKVIIVTLLAWILVSSPLPMEWAAGALMSAAAIFLMSFSKVALGRRTFYTVLFALGACTCYATIDIFLQQHGRALGVLFFLGVMNLTVVTLSLSLIPALRRNLACGLPAAAWKWMAAGIVFATLQDFMFGISVGLSKGGAVSGNILYCTRGVWAVVIVWLFGRHFGNSEFEGGGTLAFRRLLGALILFASVVLVLSAR